MDAKLVYLTKTLSRTKRKDYENYVVNAIWNRINNPKLLPVTQQFIKDKEGNHITLPNKSYTQVPLSQVKLINHNNNWQYSVV